MKTFLKHPNVSLLQVHNVAIVRVLKWYNSCDKRGFMEQILVASDPFCTEFNFARGTNTFTEMTSKFEENVCLPPSKGRYGLYNWCCICLNFKHKTMGKSNYTRFHK